MGRRLIVFFDEEGPLCRDVVEGVDGGDVGYCTVVDDAFGEGLKYAAGSGRVAVAVEAAAGGGGAACRGGRWCFSDSGDAYVFAVCEGRGQADGAEVGVF